MKAMLLAAGEGTRFRPQTLKLPKPALPFLNVPLGFYSFPFLKSIGVTNLVVNTFHLPEKIVELYQSQNDFKVDFCHEKGKILGSGGGLGNARKYFEGEKNLVLLNADEVFCPVDSSFLTKMKLQHDRSSAISTLLVKRHPEVGSKFGGIWIDAHGSVCGYGKAKPSNAVEGFHFLGVQILNHKVFDFIQDGVEQNILYDNLTAAQMAGHKVEIFMTDGHWYETGSLPDYLKATRDVLKNLVAGTKEFSGLMDFLNEKAPNFQLKRTEHATLWIDSSSKISDSEFMDFAVIGTNVSLKKTKVEAAVLGPSTSFDSITVRNELVLS